MTLQLKRQIKRQIGQILMNGGFVRKNDLDRACEEQQRTKELLGQVLVRMGVLKAREITVPLLIQDHLSCLEDAVKIAAGERKLLGTLLVQSGQITGKQLDAALAEQKRTGDRLGEVFTRLGLMTERQLEALLEFQHNQEVTTFSSPIRIGELLVSTGQISRVQLNDALYKQGTSRRMIGEVLVREGYVSPHKLKSGFRLQNMLVRSVLATVLSLGMRAPAMASGVSLVWDPITVPELAGYKIYYNYASAPLESGTVIDVSTQTAASIDGLNPEISYQFAVTAYDTTGAESLLSNVLTLEEQIPPDASITSPSNLAIVNGVVTVSANATDNVGVTKVEFYVNGMLKVTETTPPYSYSWDTTTLAPGAYALMVKAYDAAGNVSQSSSTVTVANDLIAPTVSLASPVNNSIVNGTISVSANASDNIGVSKVEFYSNGNLMYASNVFPYSFNWDTSSVANGSYALMAVAYDNAGNAGQSSAAIVTVNNPVPDITPPTLVSFTLPPTSTSLTVPVAGLTATDNIGVTGYMITESSTPPAATAAGWNGTVPTSFTFSAEGTKTAFAWAKDAAGNVSSSRSATVVMTLPDVTAPTMVSFTLPPTSTSLTVPVAGLTATDIIGVTGYMITESSTAPAAAAAGWSGTVPSSFTFTAEGTKTAFAWAKDAADNVSSSRSATVVIAFADVIAPTMLSFKMPGSSKSLTVPVSSLSATDNVGITGYLITESSTRPLASDARWSSTAPTSFTFGSAGTKTAYAWAKDKAGNISASVKASVKITLR